MRAAVLGAWCVAVLGCGGTQPDAVDDPSTPGRRQGPVVDDRSLCDWRDRKDVEVTETAGTGSFQPNVRRVFKLLGTGSDQRKVLICREVDTNLDGVKDVVRTYNDKGQSREERADTNYDGRIDTWNVFSQGRLAEVRLDKNHDGHPDEWKTYVSGQLNRVKRDTNFDTRPDVWEMYRKGRLERMGVDLDGDERVDRWDHDRQWRREREIAAKKKEEREARERKAEPDAARPDAEGAPKDEDDGG